ncbi:MAG: DNA polymerase III subunit alpha [Bacillota bacterium]|nr:DNA polymerase III subunit alpha [Bacillota bacterium]
MNHLHTRSCYSILQSPFRLEQLIKSSKEMGFRHVCLTDKHTMYGTMHFLELCRKNQIHGIVGMELEASFQNGLFHFVCLAKNDNGLQGLYALSTRISKEGVMDIETISSYTQDCICISESDGANDELDVFLQHDKEEEIVAYLSYCKSLWKDFYVSIAMNDAKYRQTKNQFLKQIARSLQIRTVALSRVFYEKKEDVEKLRILRALDRSTTIFDQSLEVTFDRYLRSPKEMELLYEQEDLEMTDYIASQCNIQMAFQKSDLPRFENKYNVNSEKYLTDLCRAGLKKRLNNQLRKEYIDRLEYELNTIVKMGFTDYFLIVYDFIRYARSQNIYVGPGRGSAAGSLVAYCLGITHIDPIENHLLFERFLNPERVTMPDIDTDFPDNRRDEVIQYVIDKYGREHVAHIITFNTLKAKQVLRDVARVTSFPIRSVEEMTKAIPNTPGMTLLKASQEIRAFSDQLKANSKKRELFELCLPLEGLPRHTSLHAAGVVMSDQPIEKVCPLVKVDDGIVATQFTAGYLEDLGLIKMDFLGIRNLTTIDNVIKDMARQGIVLNPLHLPLNDKKAYQILSMAETMGVFQLESEGIKQVLRKMKPTCFEDIAAVLALYRPSAMQNIDLFIERREHPEKVEYAHPLLKPILEETYGIMLYQEQIMQIAQVIGNFSLAQADNLRKAMSKKNRELMESYREAFIQGAYKHKLSTKLAKEIFATMEQFAEYGFNKSHSYAYSLVAYQMAYLKANYPLFFYKSVLDSVIGASEKTSEYIHECRRIGIDIKPCHIQYSKAGYTIEGKSLRMPLQVLKNIGKSVYPLILAEREKGPFRDFIDAAVRLHACKVSDSALSILIDGGAMDDLGSNRLTMRENLSKVTNYADIITIKKAEETLFDFELVSKPALMQMKEDRILKSKRELAVFGFYISEHPIQSLRKEKFPKSLSIPQVQALEEGFVGVLGKIVLLRVIKTKQGEDMAFMSLEDETSRLDVVLFPKTYKAYAQQLERDKFCFVEARKQKQAQNRSSIIANRIEII